MTFNYHVDLQRLDDTIADMKTFDGQIDTHLADLDKVIATLHGRWHGEAAASQKDAHGRWTKGAAEMKSGLKEMHDAAVIAHGNYKNAGDTNAKMWKQVR